MKLFKSPFRPPGGALATLILFLNCTSACAQHPPPDIDDILQRLGESAISVDVMDQALPRLSDEMVLFSLRGGDELPVQAEQLEQEADLKKATIVGAYFTAARWDWAQFMAGSRNPQQLDQLKYAMEEYLLKINHRLHLLQAPQDLLEAIDAIKQKFAASKQRNKTVDIREVDEALEAISSQLGVFMLKDSKSSVSFTLGKWLVWQAELSNLCLVASESDVGYLRNVMNHSFQGINIGHFMDLANEIFQAGQRDERSRELKGGLRELSSLFLVESTQDVEFVRSEVKGLFELFDLRFPSLQS